MKQETPYEPTAEQRKVMQANPEIGTLLGARGLVFYAYTGPSRIYTESYNVQAVADKLERNQGKTLPKQAKRIERYQVEVKTQYDVARTRTREWSHFEYYNATSKAEAIRQAKSWNHTHGCFDGRTFGLVWWRASVVE